MELDQDEVIFRPLVARRRAIQGRWLEIALPEAPDEFRENLDVVSMVARLTPGNDLDRWFTDLVDSLALEGVPDGLTAVLEYCGLPRGLGLLRAFLEVHAAWIHRN